MLGRKGSPGEVEGGMHSSGIWLYVACAKEKEVVDGAAEAGYIMATVIVVDFNERTREEGDESEWDME